MSRGHPAPVLTASGLSVGSLGPVGQPFVVAGWRVTWYPQTVLPELTRTVYTPTAAPAKANWPVASAVVVATRSSPLKSWTVAAGRRTPSHWAAPLTDASPLATD